MTNNLTKLLSLFLVCLASLSIGCGGEGGDSGSSASNDGKAKVYNDAVIVHQLSDPTGLHPHNTSDAGSSELKRLLFHQLLDYGVDMKLVPLLAKELPTFTKLDNGGMTIDYEIRPEATWDDGKPITADDVEFSFKAVKNPKVDAPSLRPYFEFISDFKKYPDNPKKFTFICSELNFIWDHATGTDVNIVPKHLYDPKGLSDKYSFKEIATGADKIIDSKENLEFAKAYNDIKLQREVFYGSGAYDLVKWNTDQNITFERKENWWGDKLRGTNHYFADGPQTVTYQTVNERTSAYTALKSEKLDIVRSVRAKEWVTDFPKSDKIQKNFNLLDPPYLVYTHLGLNIRTPKLKGKKTRQALAHLVDAESINENISYGLQRRVVGPIHPSFKDDYNNDLKLYDFSVEKAKALVKEDGWEDTDGNGIVDKVIDGKRIDLKITFNYNQGNDTRKQIGLVFKEAARQAGIEIEVIPMEWSVFMERLKANKIEMWYGGWVFDPRPSDPKQIWHTSSYGGGSNYTGFGNAKTDKLIEDIALEMDASKRSALYKEWQAILHEEVPYIFMFTGSNHMAVHNKFDKASVNSSGRNPGYYVNGLQPASGFSATAN